MQALQSTRSRLVLAAAFFLAAVLLLFVSWRAASSSTGAVVGTPSPSAQALANKFFESGNDHYARGEWQAAVDDLQKAREYDQGRTPAITDLLARAQSALANPPTPAPVAAASPSRSVPTATRGGTPNRSGPATPVAFGQVLTAAQLDADYALCRQALARREGNPGLYAVAMIFDKSASAVETQWRFLSADRKIVYSYAVTGTGLSRVAAERPGSPETVTADARFVPYDTLPWQKDPNWAIYITEGMSLVEETGRTTTQALTRTTLIGRTDIRADWELFYQAGTKRFNLEVKNGNIELVRVVE